MKINDLRKIIKRACRVINIYELFGDEEIRIGSYESEEIPEELNCREVIWIRETLYSDLLTMLVEGSDSTPGNIKNSKIEKSLTEERCPVCKERLLRYEVICPHCSTRLVRDKGRHEDIVR